MIITAYDILEIPVNASLDDAKHAYVRLAKRYHPDVCKESGALDRMKNINLAYKAIRDGRGHWWSPPIAHAVPEKPALADVIKWANTHLSEVTNDYLIKMEVGGRDQYSRMPFSALVALAGDGIARKVRSQLYNDKLRGTALRWTLRGLNVDLAIRKAHTDDKFYRERARHAL